jgi:dephospho-CoA kinase
MVFRARLRGPIQETSQLSTSLRNPREGNRLGLSRIMKTQPIPLPSRPAVPIGPWKFGTIPVLGLIGAIGGGKSRVAAILAGRGALVIDADRVGHAVLRRRRVCDRLVARFGEGIVARAPEDGSLTIDRRALGAVVFADPVALRVLESMVHPLMRRSFEQAIARAERRGEAPAVVLDAAILLEAGWDELCDRILYVDAPRDQRLARLSAQRGWTEARLDERERAQWPADVKRQRADAVVVNDSSPEYLEATIESLWSTLLSPPTRSGSPTLAEPTGPRGPGVSIPAPASPRVSAFSQPADVPGRH